MNDYRNLTGNRKAFGLSLSCCLFTPYINLNTRILKVQKPVFSRAFKAFFLALRPPGYCNTVLNNSFNCSRSRDSIALL